MLMQQRHHQILILMKVNGTNGEWVFTGTYTGMHATSNGEQTDNKEFFKWFSYQYFE
jgi:hypothetical protein